MNKKSEITLLDKEMALSLFCILSMEHKHITKFNDVSRDEEKFYLDYRANVQFMNMCTSVYNIITDILNEYLKEGDREGGRVVEKIIEGQRMRA